ncbi:MAG: zinc ribbon domain-containing protein [Phycisphaerae bacterium]
MGELIEALHKLQEIELQMSRLRRGEDDKLRQVRIVERKISRIDDQLEELDHERSPLQLEVEQLDADVRGREASILKHREELLKARTNKDYSAILTAINTEKADTAKLESLALEKMGQLERFQTQADTLKAERELLVKRMEHAQQAVQAYRDRTADERADCQARREEASVALPPTALSTFNRVAERHEGQALAEIERLSPKLEEFACGGCNIKVPLDTINELRSRDEIRFCGNCGRILYLEVTQATGA